MRFIERCLLSLSLTVGVSTITLPAMAATLTPTNIQFTTNGVANSSMAPNLNTWTYSGSRPYDGRDIGGVKPIEQFTTMLVSLRP
jgi:hypothetical protein